MRVVSPPRTIGTVFPAWIPIIIKKSLRYVVSIAFVCYSTYGRAQSNVHSDYEWVWLGRSFRQFQLHMTPLLPEWQLQCRRALHQCPILWCQYWWHLEQLQATCRTWDWMLTWMRNQLFDLRRKAIRHRILIHFQFDVPFTWVPKSILQTSSACRTVVSPAFGV